MFFTPWRTGLNSPPISYAKRLRRLTDLDDIFAYNKLHSSISTLPVEEHNGFEIRSPSEMKPKNSTKYYDLYTPDALVPLAHLHKLDILVEDGHATVLYIKSST